MDACTRSLALGAGAFMLVVAGALYASAAPAVGLALVAAGMLTYTAARRSLKRC